MTPLRCANGPSAARSFLQIASRSYATSPASAFSASAPLEFLIPRSRSTSRLSTSSAASARLSQQRRQPTSLQTSQFSISGPHRRAFTTTPARRGTICVQNPTKDEDGNDMTLEITPRAAKRLSQIMVKDNNPNLALRIQVESGGCHGFQYLMSLITVPAKDAEASSVVSEDDSIFQYVADEADQAAPVGGPRIILDEPSLELLKGSKVDFISELIGSSFQIVDNPLATSSCGCGTSFDVKL